MDPAELTPAPALTTPIPDVTADATEQSEWDAATNDLFPGLKKEQLDESGKPVKDAKTAEADKKPAPAAGKPEADIDTEENEAPNTDARDARVAARESAQATAYVKSDIREQMFAAVPQVLQDADGDPIKTVDDVMKLNNPRTGVAFTEEEAGMWLVSAQQQFNQNLAGIEKQIEAIAETNLDLKDQADMVSYEFGELLKEMPDLQRQIWAEYEKTLIKDAKSGIITKAPVSLERFYGMALKPYAELARKLEADESNRTAMETKTAAEAEIARKQTRSDRSDIYAGGKSSPMDGEETEWAEAAKAVFGK